MKRQIWVGVISEAIDLEARRPQSHKDQTMEHADFERL